eukprot:TRINITY_DN20807_c0_g1_i1.p2 TRINITY_DN20807_c0_g1~~TRINITY_DN20807_c0_g1_i1.p2  ORF type:complete len:147 (+),score=16.49 TRINITY_DN20807_c0_g1_i1:51-443(+)
MATRGEMIDVVNRYIEFRTTGNIDGCVSLLDESVQMDSSHGCNAGKPSVGKAAAEQRLRAHPPPRLPIVWKEPDVDAHTGSVIVRGTVTQFTLTWYQRLEVTFTDASPPRITRVFWQGRLPVRDGEGCCV